jgi:hypothetical protein
MLSFHHRIADEHGRRVASNMSMHDPSTYKVAIASEHPNEPLRFHLGEPIRVNWQAPTSHSRRDWIGIYRVKMLFMHRLADAE